MRAAIYREFSYLCGFAVMLQAAPPVPQFTGTYDVNNLVSRTQNHLRVAGAMKPGEILLPPDFRPQVTIRLTLTINNPLDIDIKNTRVELQDTQLTLRKHATFEGISFKKNDQATISAELQMPQPEFDAWQKGETPNIFITFTDDQGRLRRQKIWLKPASGGKGSH